jgi:hypothetical protein
LEKNNAENNFSLQVHAEKHRPLHYKKRKVKFKIARHNFLHKITSNKSEDEVPSLKKNLHKRSAEAFFSGRVLVETLFTQKLNAENTYPKISLSISKILQCN